MTFEIAVDSREGTSTYRVAANDVAEKLRHIGLEWKLADWAHDQAVIITVAPARDEIDAMWVGP